VANALNTNPLQGREFIVVLWAVWSLGTVLMFGRLFSGCAIIAWLFKIQEVKALTALMSFSLITVSPWSSLVTDKLQQ
jgi:hypothetical protein